MHEGPVVVFSGGGTGGHLYPALAIADALRRRRPEVRAVFIGAERGVEARVLPERGEEHHLLPVHGIDRSRPTRSAGAVARLAVSLVRAAALLKRYQPRAVVVTGGYASAPAGIVAGLMGFPLVLQEQNAVPGSVTRLLTRWASKVHVAFPEAIERIPLTPNRVRMTGNPVRVPATVDRAEARREFGVPEQSTLVLVVGGSQGSLALNRAVSDALADIEAGRVAPDPRLHLLWSTGPSHFEAVTHPASGRSLPAWVHAVPYLDDMPRALVAADLAVSRAGAMFTAELVNQGLPALLIPLPSAAADHQAHNARALRDAGAALLLPEAQLTGAVLWTELSRLAASPQTLAEMRAAALARAKPDAAEVIAADVEALLPGGGRTT